MSAPQMETIAESPILFRGALVRAVCDGVKTETRRLVKPPAWADPEPRIHLDADGGAWAFERGGGRREISHPVHAGERLWIKETWRPYAWGPSGGPWTFQYAADGKTAPEGPVPMERGEAYASWNIRLFASVQNELRKKDVAGGAYSIADLAGALGWRPSIFLPRWGSRTTLMLVSRRYERLQAITPEATVREGLNHIHGKSSDQPLADWKPRWAELWDKINGDAAPWASNPVVRVLRFELLEAR